MTNRIQPHSSSPPCPRAPSAFGGGGAKIPGNKFTTNRQFTKPPTKHRYEPVHTLVPKPTGFVALARGLEGAVTHVLDVTLAYTGYPEHLDSKGPGFAQVFSPIVAGTHCSFHIHVRRVPLKELPLHDDALMRQYLNDM